jgi:hypothetical protein
MKAEEFDKTFDDNNQEDVINNLDLSQMRRPSHHQKLVRVNFIAIIIEHFKQNPSQ